MLNKETMELLKSSLRKGMFSEYQPAEKVELKNMTRKEIIEEHKKGLAQGPSYPLKVEK